MACDGGLNGTCGSGCSGSGDLSGVGCRFALPAFAGLHAPHRSDLTRVPGFDWPSAALLWANFFDPRLGLFAWCPALILAFAAPFTTLVRHRVPQRETMVLLTYLVVFVLFCAANQYSWLQPTTGFRYLVPVVPALAVLAMQVGQALPWVVRWAVASASCTQSLVLAAAHVNDVWLALSTLWQRRLALFWMIRLGDAGTRDLGMDPGDVRSARSGDGTDLARAKVVQPHRLPRWSGPSGLSRC